MISTSVRDMSDNSERRGVKLRRKRKELMERARRREGNGVRESCPMRPGQLTAGFRGGQRSRIGSSGGVKWNLKQQEDTDTQTHTHNHTQEMSAGLWNILSL